MIWAIILVAIYLIIALNCIKRFSWVHTIVGSSYYEYTFYSILAGLFFPIAIIIILTKERLEGSHKN